MVTQLLSGRMESRSKTSNSKGPQVSWRFTKPYE
jgi:hypothetical protein